MIQSRSIDYKIKNRDLNIFKVHYLTKLSIVYGGH